MDTKGGERILLEPVENAGRGVARTAEKAFWGAAGTATKIGSWLKRTLQEGTGQPAVPTKVGARVPASTGQQPSAGARPPKPTGAPTTGREADRTLIPTGRRTPTVHGIDRNRRPDAAAATAHLLAKLKGIKDPRLQEKMLEKMDAKELRLLNRHANRVGGPNAPKGLDAGTRRACNAVHEMTERRIGDMSRWSRNPADRIPATPERNYRLVRDITRSESPTAYARESTPKERATLKNALTLEARNPESRDKQRVAETLKTVRAADEPRPTGYTAPGKTNSTSRTPTIVRGADRAIGGAKRPENSRVAALAR